MRCGDSGIATRAAAPASDTGTVDVLIVGSHLRWRGVWQRPNHIVSRLASRMRVIFVEEPLLAAADRTTQLDIDGVTLVVPERRAITDVVDDATVAFVRELVGGQAAAVWLYTPLMDRLLEACADAPLVYDKMDELAAFHGADGRLAQRERDVVARARMVFAGGHSLWETVRGRARDGAAFPSGVDAAHFARYRNSRPAAKRPVFGYVGVLDERIDFGLVAALARARPDADIELVGPVAKIEPASLPTAPNIKYVGKIEYAAIPSTLARFDVALMPFARNAATRYISPTKTLEYLAAGRPVVSTAIADVVRDFGDVVYVAETPASFVAAVAEAETWDEARRARSFAYIGRNGWDSIVSAMLDRLRCAGVRFGAPV